MYRVFNLARALAGLGDDGAPPGRSQTPGDHDEAIAVAAVFHDLGIWSDGTFDYLAPSGRRAAEHLAARGPSAHSDQVDRMIAFHHAMTSCRATAGPLAEAFRQADLIDVTLGALRFGLPRAFVREARAAFPNAGFHRCLLRVGAGWMARHPTRPLPMMRW